MNKHFAILDKYPLVKLRFESVEPWQRFPIDVWETLDQFYILSKLTDYGDFENLFGARNQSEESSVQKLDSFQAFLKVADEYFENKCRKSIIDFEFLLDSSGSIQEENWDTTVRAIGNRWIDSPLLADNCGNRVAGRRFSNERDEYQVKFHDFADYSAMLNDTTFDRGQFVGYKFSNEKYADGETAIVTALRKIIEEDIPKMRPDADKKLLIFTDGRSSQPKLKEVITEIHQKLDAVYVFGIGSKIDIEELKLMASKPEYIRTFESFDDIQDAIEYFVLMQDGCESRQQSYHEEFVFDPEFHVADGSTKYNFDILNHYKNITKSIDVAAHKNCLDSNFLYGFASKILDTPNVYDPDFNQLTEELVDTINAMNTSGTINDRMEAALQKTFCSKSSCENESILSDIYSRAISFRNQKRPRAYRDTNSTNCQGMSFYPENPVAEPDGTFEWSFKTNSYGEYVSSANCAGIFDCGSNTAKVMYQYKKFETEEKYDYMRYEDLAKNNDRIQHDGNTYYDDSSSDDDDDISEKLIFWGENGGTSKIRFSFHSDSGEEDRGVSLKLSCFYP